MVKTVTRGPARPVKKPTLVEGGKRFLIKADYKVSPHGNTVPAGHTLRELSDGWYKVFYPNGSKHFLSVGPELFKKLELQQYEG